MIFQSQKKMVKITNKDKQTENNIEKKIIEQSMINIQDMMISFIIMKTLKNLNHKIQKNQKEDYLKDFF